jgi:hypothetical protein
VVANISVSLGEKVWCPSKSGSGFDKERRKVVEEIVSAVEKGKSHA